MLISRALQHVMEDYLKHLTDTDRLYEMLIQQRSDIIRITCFIDEDQLVVLANGFQKKTQRTPRKEIDNALRIKKEYEQEKQSQNRKKRITNV
jgi:phage-related protein